MAVCALHSRQGPGARQLDETTPDAGGPRSPVAGDIPAECAELLARARQLLVAPPHPRLSVLAVELTRAAWRLAPGHPAVALRLARALCANGLCDEGVAVCDEALVEHPEAIELRLERVLLALPYFYSDAQHLADARAAYDERLTGLEEHFEDVSRAELERLGRGEGHVFPARLPYQAEDDAGLQRRLGALVSRAVNTALPGHDLPIRGRSHHPPRVGFVSSQFNRHTVWRVVTFGWLTGLTDRGFECFGYAVEGREDDETEVARGLCARFASGERSLEDWARLIDEDELDAVIYPALGYSGIADRLALLRLAPVQCTTFGECETSGSPVMDYFLSSELMEPQDGDRHYTERLVRLPDLALSYPGRRGEPSDRGRAHEGLRGDAVLLVSPHLIIKYLPRHDDLYARIAAELPDAQLVFFRDWRVERASRVFERRLRDAFAARGLDTEGRLAFLDRLPHGDYLSLLQAADVYLDVPGWNGGTTTAEALAWHVPVVALEGELARSRMGAAMLRHLAVTEGLATTEDDYVRCAVQLGRDAAIRMGTRRRLEVSAGRLTDDAARLDGLAAFLRSAIAAAG